MILSVSEVLDTCILDIADNVDYFTDVLYKLTDAIIKSADFSSFKSKKQDLLKTLTKPLTELVVQVDKTVIYDIAENKPEAFNKRILKVRIEVSICAPFIQYYMEIDIS